MEQTHEQQQPQQPKTEVRDVPFELDGAELIQRGRALADLDEEIAGLEEQKKDVAKEMKERIDLKRKEAAKLGHVIRSGKEYRPVECTWCPDPVESRMNLIRTDTGEVVFTRPMTEHERQRALFGDRSEDRLHAS